MQRLRSVMQAVRVPPVAVGSKRASLGHKMHALAHALYMMYGAWHLVCRVLNTTTSFTTDFGTERLLA
eukprot:4928696-Lingulodinium_polyedra.AAC.1